MTKKLFAMAMAVMLCLSLAAIPVAAEDASHGEYELTTHDYDCGHDHTSTEVFSEHINSAIGIEPFRQCYNHVWNINGAAYSEAGYEDCPDYIIHILLSKTACAYYVVSIYQPVTCSYCGVGTVQTTVHKTHVYF